MKIEFTNKILNNLNESMGDNGKVNLEEFIRLVNQTYDEVVFYEDVQDVYLRELSKIEFIKQTQISTNSQLRILKQFANKLGLYDASDYIRIK